MRIYQLPDLDAASEADDRTAFGNLDRILVIFGPNRHHSGERFLDFGVRPVGHHPVRADDPAAGTHPAAGADEFVVSYHRLNPVLPQFCPCFEIPGLLSCIGGLRIVSKQQKKFTHDFLLPTVFSETQNSTFIILHWILLIHFPKAMSNNKRPKSNVELLRDCLVHPIPSCDLPDLYAVSFSLKNRAALGKFDGFFEGIRLDDDRSPNCFLDLTERAIGDDGP